MELGLKVLDFVDRMEQGLRGSSLYIADLTKRHLGLSPNDGTVRLIDGGSLYNTEWELEKTRIAGLKYRKVMSGCTIECQRVYHARGNSKEDVCSFNPATYAQKICGKILLAKGFGK